jgi:hypothetical protein
MAALVWAPFACRAARSADAGAKPLRVAASALYFAGARLCHQRPDRTIHLAGCPMPVCGRCAGLYAGAPIGLVAAALVSFSPRRGARRGLALAAVPTALTLAAEWTGPAGGHVTRTGPRPSGRVGRIAGRIKTTSRDGAVK